MNFVAVAEKSTRTIVDQASSRPKCVRQTRMSENFTSYCVNVLSSSRENKGVVGIDTGKEVHGIREWELQ